MTDIEKKPLDQIADAIHALRQAFTENRLKGPDAIVITDERSAYVLKSIIRHDMSLINSAVQVENIPHSRTYIATILGVEVHHGVTADE